MTPITQTLPAWLTVTDEGVTVTLRYQASFNGVLVDKLTMRAPSVKDFNAAKMIAAGDMEKMELHLFCSLLSVAEADLLALKLKDYNRLQAGYFRLVEEDDV